MNVLFAKPLVPQAGLFHLPTTPGLGLDLVESEVAARRKDIA
jgi:L-alanine-DL-glutamate epimerase-like enolase superfamily enzyme